MKRLDVNNKGMAALVSVSPTTIGNWLAGGPPEAASILRLGQLANIPPTEVFTIAYGLPGKSDAAEAGTAQNPDPLELEILGALENRSEAEKAAALAALTALFDGIDRGKSGNVSGSGTTSARAAKG